MKDVVKNKKCRIALTEFSSETVAYDQVLGFAASDVLQCQKSPVLRTSALADLAGVLTSFQQRRRLESAAPLLHGFNET